MEGLKDILFILFYDWNHGGLEWGYWTLNKIISIGLAVVFSGVKNMVFFKEIGLNKVK